MKISHTPRDFSLMETAAHGADEFPFAYYAHHCVDAHWHKEFEFARAERGTVCCQIGQTEIVLEEGEGIFLNAGILHGFSAPSPCYTSNLLFRSDLIDGGHAALSRKYIEPFLQKDIAYLVLRPDDPEERELLRLFGEIAAASEDGSGRQELRITRLLLELWEDLFPLLDRCETIEQTGMNRRMIIRVRQMTEYMESHSREPLTLDDIAASAGISRSEANRCFRRALNTTPVAHLNALRLRRAQELLETTGGTVTEISDAVGFDSSSYFSRAFRQAYGCSPRDYRRSRPDPEP